MPGAIPLGQLAGKLVQLDAACSRCERRGRVSVARLLAAHGPAMPVPKLRPLIAAGCPRAGSLHVYKQCGIFFPGLVGLGL